MQESEQPVRPAFERMELYDDEGSLPSAVLAEHSIRMMHQILGRLVPETHDPRQIAALSIIANGIIRYTHSVYRFEPGCEHFGEAFTTKPIRSSSMANAYMNPLE